jgi:hypothetical protein
MSRQQVVDPSRSTDGETMASAEHGTRVEAAISVTMVGDRVVIRPTGRLDAEGIAAVRGLLAGAAATGAPATVDLGRLARADRRAVEVALGLHDSSVLVA